MQIKYVVEGDCWRFVGPYHSDGYGLITLDGKRQLLRRVLYERFIDPIPEGKTIGNTCGNRWCIRIEHLQIDAVRTHCLHGHKLTDDNVYRHKGQACKQCRKDQYERRKAKKLNE